MDDTPQTTATKETVAQGLLTALAGRGVDYVFANAGTDFAPIIEGLVNSTRSNATIPTFMTVPHETVAVAMSGGYYTISGKPAGVMVHVNVGTANALCMLMSCSRDNLPILLMAGRTPLTETGHAGSRNGLIHWGQENFDQSAMLREYVKWDYELRTDQPVDTIVGRAIDIAMSEPRGPIYLNLPREVLGNEIKSLGNWVPDRAPGNAPAIPTQAVIEAAAKMLAEAENPLIISGKTGGSAEVFAAMSKLANDFGIPVTQVADPSLTTDDPMNWGFRPQIYCKAADVIVVVDSPVPWMPRLGAPSDDAKIIQIAPDPLYSRFPFRGFHSDLALAGSTAPTLTALHAALAETMKGKKKAIETRRKRAREEHDKIVAERAANIEKAKTARPILPVWLTHCVNQVKAKDAIVVSELGLNGDALRHEAPRSYVTGGLAGALGFGLGAALGAKLAARNREVICAVGDGSYMFGCPTAAHYVGRAESLPTLTIVANNNMWLAVRQATLGMYPQGNASKANAMPLTELAPSPAFEKTIEACDGYGEMCDDPAKLQGALERCLDKVRGGQQALLNVRTAPTR
jgi:acetolactate synthase-1/2/3 large subunit